MKKTRKHIEEYLNGLFEGENLLRSDRYCYLAVHGKGAVRLLKKGKLGTALRKYDPIAFNVYCQEQGVL